MIEAQVRPERLSQYWVNYYLRHDTLQIQVWGKADHQWCVLARGGLFYPADADSR